MAARSDRATRAGAFKRVRDQLGVPPTLRTWVRDAEVAGKIRPGVPGAEAARIAELEREFRELRRGTLS